jgi:hypothetical protein
MGDFLIAGAVAATQKFGLNETNVFSVDPSGQLKVCWVDNAGAWNGPVPIGPTGLANPGCFMATSQQFGANNQTDLFLVGGTGQVNVFSAVNAGAWNGPQLLGSKFEFPPAAYIAASQQFGASQQTDVFLFDNNGQLNVFWVNGAGAWNGPQKIGPAGIANGGSFLAVSQQFGANQQTDVFFLDKNGQLNVFWVNGTSAWGGPEKIGPTSIGRPGSFLAASQQFGANEQTDVFLFDQNGQLNVFWVNGAGGWGGPEKIGPVLIGNPGSYLAVSQQFGANEQTDVFFVDKNGFLNVAWVNSAGPWQAPEPVGPTSNAMPGCYLAASQQFGAVQQTDVFLIDKNGYLNVFWVNAADPWGGPLVVDAPPPPPPPPPPPSLPLAPVDLAPANGSAGISNNPYLYCRDPGAGTPAAAGQFEIWLFQNNRLLNSPPATGASIASAPLSLPGVRWGWGTLPVGEVTFVVSGQNRAGTGPSSSSTFTVDSSQGTTPTIKVSMVAPPAGNVFEVQGTGFTKGGLVDISASSPISDVATQAKVNADGNGSFTTMVPCQTVCSAAGGGQLQFIAADAATNLQSNVILETCH